MSKLKGDLKLTAKTDSKYNQTIEFSVSGRNAKNLRGFHAGSQQSGIINPATQKPYRKGRRPVIANAIRRNLKAYDKLQKKNLEGYG